MDLSTSRPQPPRGGTDVRGGGDLVTTEKFRDFELTWEWKIAHAGNSGIKYDLQNPTRAVGFEHQIPDDINHPDGVKCGTIHQTAVSANAPALASLICRKRRSMKDDGLWIADPESAIPWLLVTFC